MFGPLDDKDKFGGVGFQRQEVAYNIDKLRHIVATNPANKHATMLLKSMERLYTSQFGEPYNPTPDTPRI